MYSVLDPHISELVCLDTIFFYGREQIFIVFNIMPIPIYMASHRDSYLHSSGLLSGHMDNFRLVPSLELIRLIPSIMGLEGIRRH